MTANTTNTPAVGSQGLSEQLGPLPEGVDSWFNMTTQAWTDRFSPEQMHAERERCYALGVAAERGMLRGLAIELDSLLRAHESQGDGSVLTSLVRAAVEPYLRA